MTQLNRHTNDAILKPSCTNDAILKPSRMNDATHQVTKLHARHEYGIIRSPIRRNSGRGVCGGVIPIRNSINITRRRTSWHGR
ncbi:hypothetical protein TNCV_4054111 [Trichonephila clavipes]|nr:hypothetical protein TNCV_4054111 [Trichonephila clavipes]